MTAAEPVASATEPCGEYAGGIPRMGIALACQRPRGHEGRHEAFVSATEPGDEPLRFGADGRAFDYDAATRCVTCSCGFRFGAEHTDGDTGLYSCPVCAEAKMTAERDAALARAEQAEREQAREHDRAVDASAERDRLAAEVERLRGGYDELRDQRDAALGSWRANRNEIDRLAAELATARRDAANRVRQMAALFSFRSLSLTVSEAKHECLRAADDIERGPAKE